MPYSYAVRGPADHTYSTSSRFVAGFHSEPYRPDAVLEARLAEAAVVAAALRLEAVATDTFATAGSLVVSTDTLEMGDDDY